MSSILKGTTARLLLNAHIIYWISNHLLNVWMDKIYGALIPRTYISWSCSMKTNKLILVQPQKRNIGNKVVISSYTSGASPRWFAPIKTYIRSLHKYIRHKAKFVDHELVSLPIILIVFYDFAQIPKIKIKVLLSYLFLKAHLA